MATRTDILFKSAAEVMGFFPVNVALNFESLHGPIKAMQKKWIIPLIGQDQMDLLLEGYHNTMEVSPEVLELIEVIQEPLACLAFDFAIPHLNLNVTQGGFTVIKSQNAEIASQYRVNSYREQLYTQGQQSMDTLLGFLDEHESDFPTYESSNERINQRATILNSPAQFAENISIPVGWFVVNRMLPIIKRVENTLTKNVLCEPLYTEIKSLVASREDLGVYAPLLPLIHAAETHLVLASAVDELGLSIGMEGLQMIRNYSSAANSKTKQNPADDELERFKRAHLKIGETAMAQLADELKTNPANYPLWESSQCNVEFSPPPSRQVVGSSIFRS